MDLQTSYKDIKLPKMIYENYIEDKLEQDLTIPDYYCSAQKIIRCEANAVVLNSSISDDKVMLEGQCIWEILYLSDEDKALHHITCERNFNEIFSVEANGGKLRYKIKTKNVLCKLQSPTRAACKATLCLAVKIDGIENVKILADAADENVQLNYENATHYELALRNEKEFKVTGEMTLKHLEEFKVFKAEGDVIVRECKCYDGKTVVKGICRNHIILLSVAKCDAECIEIETPFTQVFEGEMIRQGWMPCIHCRLSDCDVSVSDDSSEELLTVVNTIVGSIDVYSPCALKIITDAYHLKNELISKNQSIEFYRDIQKLEIGTHLSQKVHLNTSDMSVLYFESHCEIEKIDVGDGVLIVDAKLLVDCLYSVNDNVCCGTFAFPFQTTKPLDGEFQSLKCEAEASVNNFGFIILSDSEMEISCDCCMSLMVYVLNRCDGVADIEVGEEKDNSVLQTPLVLYYGSKGEKIWDICKKYSVSVRAVTENNDIVGEVLQEDQFVLITNH